MSSGTPDFAGHHNKPESLTNLKHDGNLPASPCSRFVTSYHLISHRYVNVRSTSGPPSLDHLDQTRVKGSASSLKSARVYA